MRYKVSDWYYPIISSRVSSKYLENEVKPYLNLNQISSLDHVLTLESLIGGSSSNIIAKYSIECFLDYLEQIPLEVREAFNVLDKLEKALAKQIFWSFSNNRTDWIISRFPELKLRLL